MVEVFRKAVRLEVAGKFAMALPSGARRGLERQIEAAISTAGAGDLWGIMGAFFEIFDSYAAMRLPCEAVSKTGFTHRQEMRCPVRRGMRSPRGSEGAIGRS